MDEPRIAMFMPGLKPASLGWHVHVDFARHVTAAGPRFRVLTTDTDSSPRVMPPDGPIQTLPRGRLAPALAELLAPALRTRSLVPSVTAMTRFLRTEGCAVDLLHVEVAYPHGAAVALARRAAGWVGPLVVTPMGEDTLVLDKCSYGFRRYRVPRALVGWTLRNADLIRCISPLHERWIRDLAPGVPRLLLPLNVSETTAVASTESATDRRQRRAAARAWIDTQCPTAGHPIVVALGRLHPFKGIDVLVRSMASVPDAVLVIVGPSLDIRPHGDCAPGLLKLAAATGVGERVHWVGPSPPERALDWLAGADVLAVPSHLESLNKVCMEAAAVGTPFVVTQTTGISAWVPPPTDGVGHVVPPDDPVSLGRALYDITAGRWQPNRDRLAAFAQQFRPEPIARALVTAYRELLSDRGRGAV